MDTYYRLANSATISGRGLSSRHLTKSQKAALGAQIVLGEREGKLGDLAQRQVAKLLGVSVPYIQKAAALDFELRQAVLEGDLSLADIPAIPTEKKLDDTVKAAGIERTWDAICKQL
jgi:hypothetical protein